MQSGMTQTDGSPGFPGRFTMKITKLNEVLTEDREARLFPVLKSAESEMRATSALLSTLRSVREFSQAIMKIADGPSGATRRVECFVEVTLEKTRQDQEESRLDGVIVSSRGRDTWVALMEVKTGTNKLDQTQFDKYLELARDNDFNAIITVSNQPSQTNNYPPLNVKYRGSKICIIHLSWERLLREAQLLIRQDSVEDADQQYILKEWVRYLLNPKTKILSDHVVGDYWQDVIKAASNKRLKSSKDKLEQFVQDWVGFLRFQTFRLRSKLGGNVEIKLKLKEQKDSSLYIKRLIDECLNEGHISSSIQISHAVAPIDVTFKLDSRKILFSVSLKPPADKDKSKQIIWLRNEQLKNLKESLPDLLLVIEWKFRDILTEISVTDAIKDRKNIENTIEMANIGNDIGIKSFRIEWSTDMARKKSEVFSSIGDNMEGFYRSVIQNLKVYIPSTPKIEQDDHSGKQNVKDQVLPEYPHQQKTGEEVKGIV